MPRLGGWSELWRGARLVLLIEVGLLLVTLPWTPVWDRNVLVLGLTAKYPWVMSAYLRGAFSGLGLVNLWVAASEITGLRL